MEVIFAECYGLPPLGKRVADVKDAGMAEDLTDAMRCAAGRIQTEYKGLLNGIANVILSWATVENELVKLLTAVLKQDNMKLPAAMYFSLTGLDGRRRMVDSALRELLAGNNHEKRIECAWNTISKKIKQLTDVRNAVAHGQIVHVAHSPMGNPAAYISDLRH
jgi:hypothetical protein